MAAERDILDEIGVEIAELAVDELPSELGELICVFEDMLDEGFVLIGSEELVEETRLVELEESAEILFERLVEDEESKRVLAALEILEPEKLVGEVALVDRSVGELEVVAIMLEGLVLDTPFAVDERELTAGELKDVLAEDEIPLSIELEIVDDAEVGLTIEVREDGLELSGDVEDRLKLDDAGAALDVELVDMIKGIEDVETDEGLGESTDVELVV